MSTLTWSPQGEFHRGVDRGVFYDADGFGVAWSGLVGVTTSEDSSATIITYIDGEKYMLVKRRGSFSASVEAFMYPP